MTPALAAASEAELRMDVPVAAFEVGVSSEIVKVSNVVGNELAEDDLGTDETKKEAVEVADAAPDSLVVASLAIDSVSKESFNVAVVDTLNAMVVETASPVTAELAVVAVAVVDVPAVNTDANGFVWN